MPFITEEIYSHLDEEYESITISKWPEYSDDLHDEKAEKDMGYIIEAITALRNVRSEMNVPPSKKLKLWYILQKKMQGKHLKKEKIIL